VIVGSVNTPGIARGVAVTGQCVYVGDYYSGLQVVDVTDPTDPTIIENVKTSYRARRIRVVDDLAYCVFEEGIQILDIADPARPRIIGQIPTESYGVSIVGDLACIAGGWSEGLRTVPAQCEISSGSPESPNVPWETLLLPPSPNPAAHHVRFRVTPHAAEDLRLVICDAAGRIIRHLSHSSGRSEVRELSWDARDDADRLVTSGVYFVRATWGGRTESARFVLLESRPW
jgi:hypothetical protein